jgi:hypothetical protein
MLNFLRAALCSAAFSLAAFSGPLKSDFVFLIDATSSMSGEIAAVRAGLSSFVTGLNAASIDARFAIVVFGGAPELVLDFTSDATAAQTAFNKVAIGAVPGFQNNHNVNPEAGLEAIRMVLNAAPESGLARNNVGGSGPLLFRPDARKNLILATDEDSDLPFYSANRVAGQSSTDPPSSIKGTAWQTEVDNTASAVISNNAFLNMLINTGDTPVASQYGNPGSSVEDPDFTDFDAAATLAKLILDGYGNSLQAQVLNAGLVARTFNITKVNDANFVKNFYAAKVEESLIPLDPVPEPSTYALVGLGLAAVVWSRRRAT